MAAARATAPLSRPQHTPGAARTNSAAAHPQPLVDAVCLPCVFCCAHRLAGRVDNSSCTREGTVDINAGAVPLPRFAARPPPAHRPQGRGTEGGGGVGGVRVAALPLVGVPRCNRLRRTLSDDVTAARAFADTRLMHPRHIVQFPCPPSQRLRTPVTTLQPVRRIRKGARARRGGVVAHPRSVVGIIASHHRPFKPRWRGAIHTSYVPPRASAPRVAITANAGGLPGLHALPRFSLLLLRNRTLFRLQVGSQVSPLTPR